MVRYLNVILACQLLMLGAHMSSASFTSSNRTIKQVVQYIKHHYDNTQRPKNQDNKAVNVTVDLVVISFGALSDINMDFSLEFYVRQYWHDPLLKYDRSSLDHNSSFAILNEDLISHLWKPDTYIENAKHVGFSDSDVFVNQGLRLFPDGNVFTSSRVSAKLSCKMNFEGFPMDKQICLVVFSSYFYTEKDIYMSWGEISYEETQHNNQFDLLGFTSERNSLVFTTGNFSSLTVAFKFRRRIQTYLMSFYIPSLLTVMLSWVSFYISPNSAPARCALGIVTVLAVGGFLTGQKSSFPVVSYVMAADLYILVCYVFTFLALVEYAAVHYLYVYERQLHQFDSKKDHSKNIPAAVIDEGELNSEDKFQIESISLPQPQNLSMASNNKVSPHEPKPIKNKCRFFRVFKQVVVSPLVLYQSVRQDALLIDKFSRVIFPTTFCLFNIVYWYHYKSKHNSND